MSDRLPLPGGALRVVTVVIAAVALPLAVLAAYDVTGTSAPDPFVTGARTATPTHTAAASTNTATITPAPTATPSPTPTGTATAQPCGRVSDASLSFVKTEIRRAGSGPFEAVIELRNNGRQSAAIDVTVRLETIKGAAYIDEVSLPDGDWDVGGLPSSHLYPAGTIVPLSTIDIPLTVTMSEAWNDASEGREAKLRASIASAACLRHASSARSTLTLRKEAEADESQRAEASETREVTYTPDAGTPSPAPAADTATPTPSASPTAEATRTFAEGE